MGNEDNDETLIYRENVFVGRSTAEGEGEPTLEKAFKNAYNKAAGKGKTPPYRVLEIWVDGTNPLSDYIVALKTGG